MPDRWITLRESVLESQKRVPSVSSNIPNTNALNLVDPVSNAISTLLKSTRDGQIRARGIFTKISIGGRPDSDPQSRPESTYEKLSASLAKIELGQEIGDPGCYIMGIDKENGASEIPTTAWQFSGQLWEYSWLVDWQFDFTNERSLQLKAQPKGADLPYLLPELHVYTDVEISDCSCEETILDTSVELQCQSTSKVPPKIRKGRGRKRAEGWPHVEAWIKLQLEEKKIFPTQADIFYSIADYLESKGSFSPQKRAIEQHYRKNPDTSWNSIVGNVSRKEWNDNIN